MARLEEIRTMRSRRFVPQDVPRLIELLDPVIPSAHPEVEGLPEGYSHEAAFDALVEIGGSAVPALLDVLRHDPKRRWCAFSILAGQGRLEPFDAFFALDEPAKLTLYESVQYWLAGEVPRMNLHELEAWYKENRSRLVFDHSLRMFRIPKKK